VRTAAIDCTRTAREDFPRLPESTTPIFTVDAEALLETVAQVSRPRRATSRGPCSPGSSRVRAGKLVMAATDSYRLAVKETRSAGSTQELEAIIPARALTELARIAAAPRSSSSACRRTRSRSGPRRVLTTRRIDGQFPNVKQLLPEQFEHVVHAAAQRAARRRAPRVVMAQRNSPLRLRFADGELRCRRRRRTWARRGVAAGAVRGEPLEIGFNPEFLRDGIESVQSDEIS
jgi:DNA polymerase-3 subunit beta